VGYTVQSGPPFRRSKVGETVWNRPGSSVSDGTYGTGDEAEALVGPVAVSRSRGAWSLLLLALAVALTPAALESAGLLDGPERAAGSFLERHVSPPDPSGRVWILRVEDESAMRLGFDDPVELWKAVLDRAQADGVARIVVLDPGSFPAVARALTGRESGPRVILPSRVRYHPTFDLPSGVDRPLPDVDAAPHPLLDEALLQLQPDADGAWRRVSGQRTVQGRSVRTMAGLLAPPDLADRPEFVLAFNTPGGLPSGPVWSFVRAELGQSPWRGGTLVICRDEALEKRDVWAPYGQPLSEPRAVAQLAESLGTGRLYRELPAALVSPLFFGLFLAAAFAAARLAPFPGFLAGATAALAVLAAAVLARIGALWIVPLSPILPAAALGAAVGLVRRHHLLERLMAQAGVSLGQSRALHPLLRSFTLDGAVLRRAADLLDLEAAALLDLRRPDPLVSVATRGDQEPFVRRAKSEVPRLLETGRPTRHLPLFAPAGEAGPGALLIPLGDDPGFHLYLLPRAAAPEPWWEANREDIERLAVSLSFTLRAAEAAATGASIPPEEQLDVLRTTASRTEAERILLLRLMGRLPGGVLVCDLVGRTLLHNQTVERLATALRLAPENFLLGLLRTSSGRDEPALWRALRQVIHDKKPWTFYAKTEVPEPRHHLFQLCLLDLGPGATGVLPREVLVLAATDVTGLARMAAARAKAEEPAAAPPAFVANACGVMDRMLDVLQNLLVHGSAPLMDEQIRQMRSELDALKTPMTTLTKKDTEAVEAVDLVSEVERAVADALPIATEVGIELRVRGDELVPMALARPLALKRALALLLRKGVSSWRRAPTLWFQAYSTGTEVVLRMATEGTVDAGRRRETATRVSSDALSKAVQEAGGRFGVGEEGDLRLAFPALAT
jgi:hypothetical protein